MCAELKAKQEATRAAMWGDKHTTQAERRQILKDSEEDAEEEEQSPYSRDNEPRQSHYDAVDDEGEDGWYISLYIYTCLSIYIKETFSLYDS